MKKHQQLRSMPSYEGRGEENCIVVIFEWEQAAFTQIGHQTYPSENTFIT
jgi:hypothetical protein